LFGVRSQTIILNVLMLRNVDSIIIETFGLVHVTEAVRGRDEFMSKRTASGLTALE